MHQTARFQFYKTCESFTTVIIKKTKRLSLVNLSIVLLSTLVLLWTHELYQNQKQVMRRIIFEVLGKERNATLAVMPGVNTAIQEPPDPCQFQGKNALAILMINTIAENRARRDLIRQTWGSKKYRGDIVVLFFSGRPTFANFKDLREEGQLHEDLIIDDFHENYYGLTIKTLRILKWFLKSCRKSAFLIKADDDVYINLQLVANHLQKLKKSAPEFKIGGRLLKGRSPHTMNPFSKWYTPIEMLPPDFTPPDYVGGGFYAIKGDFVPELFRASVSLPLYHLEDVFLSGMVANQQLGVKLDEFPQTLDPKYPRLSYFTRTLFTNFYNSFTSFHVDGDLKLIKRIFDDMEALKKS